MTTIVEGHRWGRHLFVAFWVLGLSFLTASVSGLLPLHLPSMVAVIFSLSLSILVGVLCQRCGFFARPVVRVDGAGGRCSLTFDDGPDAEFTPQILDLLAESQQRATFFVIGEKARRHPELLSRLVQEGHEIGNHTMRHAWHMSLWPKARVADEMNRTSCLVEQITGVRPRLVRPPAAILSPRIEAGARQADLRLVGFSMRSGDGSPLVPANWALSRLVRGLRPGAILVLHDAAVGGVAPAALSILPKLCAAMERVGLRSVPVSELMSKDKTTGESPPR